ncbi:MAG: Leucine-rich repeat (LRR) protein [Bacteroidia bacterium]|jgi:Leucine-rich repeat (LRR) protein
MNCPVCNTTAIQDKNCKECFWHFPDQIHSNYRSELAKASREWAMMNNHQVFMSQINTQFAVLEEISNRLTNVESKLEKNVDSYDLGKTRSNNNKKPSFLESIQKAEDFNTPEKRMQWWQSLEKQWKDAFCQGFLRLDIGITPTDKDLQDIFSTSVLRLVGPKGGYPNLGLELTNLSGLKHLTELNICIVTDCALVSLEGVEYLEKLDKLFVNNNKIENIDSIRHISQLQELYCHSNKIFDLLPLENLTNLEVLYCYSNDITNFEGLTMEHTNSLKEFVCLPNKLIKHKNIMLFEQIFSIKCREC